MLEWLREILRMLGKYQKKINGFLVLGLLVGVLIVAGIIYYVSSYESRSLSIAKRYLAEYKTEKALNLIERVKLQSKKVNPELDFLLFYTYIKSSEFTKAETLLKDIEDFNEHEREAILEIVAKLNFHNENKLLLKILEKSHDLHFEPEFFINISKKKDNIVAESLFIESGVEYFVEEPDKAKILNNYLIKRYIEVAQIEQGTKNYFRAVKYLEKAREKAIAQKGSPYQSEIYLNLGMIYRSQKKYEKAWEHIQLSAKLGNEKAKDLIKHLQNKS